MARQSYMKIFIVSQKHTKIKISIKIEMLLEKRAKIKDSLDGFS